MIKTLKCTRFFYRQNDFFPAGKPEGIGRTWE